MAKTRGTDAAEGRGGKRVGSGRGGGSARGKDDGRSGPRGVKKGRAARSPSKGLTASKESSDPEDEPPRPPGRRGKAPTKEAAPKKTAPSKPSARVADTDGDDADPVTRSKTRSPSPPGRTSPRKEAVSPKKKAPARDVTKPLLTIDKLTKAIPPGSIPKVRTAPSKRPKPAARRVDDGAVTKPRKRGHPAQDSLTPEETRDIKNHQRSLANLIKRMKDGNDGRAWGDFIATLEAARDRMEEILNGDFVRRMRTRPRARG